jgi:hypothetical protein
MGLHFVLPGQLYISPLLLQHVHTTSKDLGSSEAVENFWTTHGRDKHDLYHASVLFSVCELDIQSTLSVLSVVPYKLAENCEALSL